jgi:hypothetical protein
MKTIRHNTYETNSSSTHSITVINKKHDRSSNAVYASILENNVLYPKNLNKSEAYTELAIGGGGYIIKCRTAYQKAALTIHYLNGMSEYVKYECSGIITEDVYTEFKNKAINILQTRLGLNSIEDANTACHYSVYFEDGDCPLMNIIEKEDPITAFNEYVTDIILNDEMIIIDEDIPY